MTFIPIEISRKYNPKTDCYDDVKYSPCPFNVRDLQNDNCYDGNGKNRCKWFVRYDWEKHAGCIVCKHPPLKESLQREFNFD
jgi:hypothetical protein